MAALFQQPISRLLVKREGPKGDYCVAVRDEKLILTVPNDDDLTQLWYKDDRDNGFLLVNKSSGKVIQYYNVGAQLELVDMPSNEERSVMWTLGDAVSEGYSPIRTFTDEMLVMNACNKGHISDGAKVSIELMEFRSDNYFWNLVPYAPRPHKLLCKGNGHEIDYCVAVEDNQLILSRPNDDDLSQLWYKDSYDTGFMLVNKPSGKVIRYSKAGDQLELVNKPNGLERYLMWTSSDDVFIGYITIKTLNDSEVVMTTSQPLQYGSPVTTGPYDINLDSDFWKLVPYAPPTHKVFCKGNGLHGDYCIAVRDNKLVLTLPNLDDHTQAWYKDSYDSGFMLVNKATNKSVQYYGVGDQLELVNKPGYLERSLTWTTRFENPLNEGYITIRTLSNYELVMEATSVPIDDGTSVSISPSVGSDAQMWKLV